MINVFSGIIYSFIYFYHGTIMYLLCEEYFQNICFILHAFANLNDMNIYYKSSVEIRHI